MSIDLEEVTAIVRRHRELGEVIADLVQQRADLEDRYDALVPVGFSLVVDGQESSKRAPSRRFDLPTAVAACNALGFAVRQVWEYDKDDARRLLKAAGRLDDAMLPGTGKNRVQL